MKSDEDDEFDRIERENKIKGQPYHFALQRTWVGLTDEEKDDFKWKWMNTNLHYANISEFIEAIEAKLKQKNT